MIMSLFKWLFSVFGLLVGQNKQVEVVTSGSGKFIIFQHFSQSLFLLFIKLGHNTKSPTGFDCDLLMSPLVLPVSVQKLIKHVSRVSTSIRAPFVTASLNRTAALLWFTSMRRKRRSKKTPQRQRRLMTRPDPGHQLTSWDRALDICPLYRKWADGFVTAGANRGSRLNWFNLWPLRGVKTKVDLICSQDQNTVEEHEGREMDGATYFNCESIRVSKW